MRTMQAKLTEMIESVITKAKLDPVYANDGASNMLVFYGQRGVETVVSFSVQFNANYMSVRNTTSTYEWPKQGNNLRDFPFLEYAKPGNVERFLSALWQASTGRKVPMHFMDFVQKAS